ncbi:alpha-2,8-polysialyltransferase family protein [Moraxella nasicaprae]|uniref:Alpha-2,8-polysialyltransferase family protein n=1 Tax=Moraxella nasicaprae TaxID=2904122 RepID=A0ABY6F1X8_9GAMM|nr:alpha-2,8-polysialyltransferase family protein [Moraxella nasicaprae]UXZ04106.1 alpha-2,8-polysialyltransferase family protein [Moraxella nasicaprae]
MAVNKISYLAICDNPEQIVQLLGYEKINKQISFENCGANLLVLIDQKSASNADDLIQKIRQELNENFLINTQIIQYQPEDIIYSHDYTQIDAIRSSTQFIREKVGVNVVGIFCSDLQDRFTKIHLDALPKSSVYLLNNGVFSYLEKLVKHCESWVSYYRHKGVVLNHLNRVKQANLIQMDLGVPNSYLNQRPVHLDLIHHKVTEVAQSKNVFLGLDVQKRSIMTMQEQDYWLKKALSIKLEKGFGAVFLGQNLASFCNNFHFRDELELHLEVCEKLLQKYQKIIFVPDAESRPKMIELMKQKLSNPDNVLFMDFGTYAESLVFVENAPKIFVGFYNSSLWNLKNILDCDEVYNALGWDTLKLYQELAFEIHKQAYRKSRLHFYSFDKLLLG